MTQDDQTFFRTQGFGILFKNLRKWFNLQYIDPNIVNNSEVYIWDAISKFSDCYIYIKSQLIVLSNFFNL